MPLHRVTQALVLCLVALAAACASSQSKPPEASSVVVTDSELASQISLAFHEKNLDGWVSIDIEVNQGVVTLSGVLKSQDLIAQAVKIAGDVSGVTKVHSVINVAATN